MRQVETRRPALRSFDRIDPERLRADERAEVLRKMAPALKDLEAALTSKDAHVYDEAVRDVMNGCYRSFPADRLLPLLLRRLKTPELSRRRMGDQGLLMEHLSRLYGPKARAALPDLLAMVTNDKVNPYLRGQAIDAAARIAPGDRAVVKAFITALTNPNPQNQSGVHDRAAAWLGEMGKAAAAAKPALRKLMDRSAWNQDAAFVALGKIDRDEPARPLDAYLARLEKLDRIPVEQAAVAFQEIVSIGKAGKKQQPGSSPGASAAIDVRVAKVARPVLLKIIESRPDDVYSRAALRALSELGPGASPQAAKAIVRVLLRDHSHEAYQALQRLETTDPKAVTPLAEAFARSAVGNDWWTPEIIAETLARFGKAARPATPAVIKALRSFHTSATPGAVYGEVFATYLSVLAAVGGDEPGVRGLVIDLLDPASDVLTKSGPNAPDYQMHLLLTLEKLGLPNDGKERRAALTRVRAGLGANLMPVFGAAARVVIAAKPLPPKEARSLVQPLARVLAPGFMFRDVPPQLSNRMNGFLPESLVLVVRALGSLGAAARDGLPAVKAIAERPLEKRTSDYLPEPPMNAVILAARKAVEAIH